MLLLLMMCVWLSLDSSCYGLNVFEHLVLSKWHCLGRLWKLQRCGLGTETSHEGWALMVISTSGLCFLISQDLDHLEHRHLLQAFPSITDCSP